MTLVEVLIAVGIFSIVSVGLTATFIQNLRFAKIISHRTQAINTAMSVVEQLREKGFTDLLDNYYLPTTPPAFTVKIVDPTASSAFPSYYRDLTIPINVRGSNTLNSDWTTTNIPVDSDPTKPKMPMKFWLSINRDSGTGTSLHEVFQVTLLYQWRSPGATSAGWKTGNMRIVAAKTTVGSAN
jgi:type II secretory pathway pseudopilin PulG